MATVDLKKLFVWVPSGKKTDVQVKELSLQTGNSEKIFFNAGTGAIITNGVQFGSGSDLTANLDYINAILAGLGANEADPNKTVVSLVAQTKADLLGTATTSAAETQTIGAVSDRVKTIETLIAADGNEIDKLQEVLDWFAGVKDSQDPYTVTVGGETIELGKGQAGLLTTVAENKKAIGEKGTGTPDVKYTQEEADAENANHLIVDGEGKNPGEEGYTPTYEEGYTPKTTDDVKTPASDDYAPSTGLYKEIDDLSDRIDDIIGELPQDKTIGETIDDLQDQIDEIEDTIGDVPEGTTVMEEVAKAKTTVTKATGSFVTVNPTTATDGHTNYELDVTTVSLNDTVGMIKNEAGKWVAGPGMAESATDGLATAADVAAEIVADEEVIAAALNDHEDRVHAIETFSWWEELA